MRRVLLPALLALGLGACSLVEGTPPLQPLWSVEDAVPEAVFGSPWGALDAEHFYVVRGRSAAGARQLVAFDRDDGAAAWRADVTGDCAPPIAVAGRVFCPTRSLHAFDPATGHPLWTLAVDSTLSLVEGTADATRVFAGSLTSAYAVDAATGALLWRRHFAGPGWLSVRLRSFTLTPDGATLLVAFEALYDASAFRSAAVIVALDPSTGAERWRYQDGDATTDRAIGSLTLWGDLIVYSDSHGNATAEAVAVDRATREVRWRAPAAEPTFLGARRAPLLVDGVAMWASGDGRAYAANAATGQPRWSVETGLGGHFHHEVCGSHLLAINVAIAVLDPATGAGQGMLFDDEEVGPVAVGDGRLYVSTERGVYAFDCG